MQLPARLLFPLWLLCLAFSTRAQTISLTVDNQALEKVMASIEQQSGHRFIYSSEMMALSKPVTVSFRNETLARALEICFKDQPLTYTLNDKHIVLQVKKPKAAAEEKRVFTGQVVDEKGEGLPGISVLIKGTSKGTTTDAKGQFLLDDVPASFRLEVSGVSIETREIAITNTSFLKIETTQKLGELDQTVVIAYGSAKKRYLVESVSKVKGEDISKQSVSNPILALGGRVAGLQIIQGSGVPGSVVQFRLRGVNSLLNGTDPLFVVDGIPFPSTPNNRSFLGAGISASPLDNLNPANIESIEVLKDAAATAIYGSRGANGVILITTKKPALDKPEIQIQSYFGFGKIARSYNLLNTKQYLEMRREAFQNDNAIPNTSNAPDLTLWDSARYTNWQKLLIGNQMSLSDLNISASFGNAQTRLLLGAGYRNESSVFAGDFYSEKISGMANVNHRSSDGKLDIALAVSYLQNRSVLPKDDLTTYIKTVPNAPELFTPDGKLNWSNSTWINPWNAVLRSFVGQAETWQSSLNVGYRLVKNLELRLNGGLNSIVQNDRYKIPSVALNPATNQLPTAGFARRDIRTIIFEPQLNYRIEKANNRLNLLLGGTIQTSFQNGIGHTATGYASDDLMSSISNASTVTFNNESFVRYRYCAIFWRAQYDFNNKYLMTASWRRDGSSRYGPAHRFANFSSIGLGWVLTSERWFKRMLWLDMIKIRSSIGKTGNDQIGDYKYLNLYSPAGVTYQGTTTYSPTQLYSPDYKWEKVRKIEIAFDFSLLKGTIVGAFSYYHNNTTSQLVNYSLPFTTGFSGVLRNIPANILNKGWEFEVSTHLIQNKDWFWSTSLNISIPRNKLVSFEGLETSSYASTYVLGRSSYAFKVLKFEKVDPVMGVYQVRDFNKDQIISTPADFQQVVSTEVSYYGGFESILGYKSFSLSFHLNFTKAPHQPNYLLTFGTPGSFENQPLWVLDRWRKQQDITTVQKFSAVGGTPNIGYSYLISSDASFTDASYLRIRNVQLTYQFQRSKIYLSCQNLLTVTRFKGLDPETGSQLPPVKTLTAGINITL